MIGKPFLSSALVDKARVDNRLTKQVNKAETRPFRLAVCVPDFPFIQEAILGKPSDAASIQQAYIVSGLQARGHDLTFLSPLNLDGLVCTKNIAESKLAERTWSTSSLYLSAAKLSWKVQRLLNIPYLNIFSNYSRLDAAIRCLSGHDIVYERNSLFNNSIAKACHRLKIPYVIFFDADQIKELDYVGTPLSGALLFRARQLLRSNLSVAQCVICVSEQSRSDLINNWSVPKEKIVVFPNVADVNRFRPDPKNRLEKRAVLGIGDQPLIIFLGNFYKWHDVHTLLDAFSLVIENQPGAQLFLVGDGAERLKMMRYAIDLNINQAVHFTGLIPHTEIPSFLAAADVAVAPYPPMDTDLWLSPLKLFEYMASGTAVVASNVGQISDVISDGKNGLLVAPGDILELAEAINRLIVDHSLRSKLGCQAREDAVRIHSWDHYLVRLERLFAAIIKGQPISDVIS